MMLQKRIRKIVLEQNPNADKEDDHGAISVAVSLDGTWQKKGVFLKNLALLLWYLSILARW